MLEKRRILLVEDDDSMRRLLEVVLRKARYDVICAEDGLKALQILSEEKIDCLITDAIMPGISGFDLCRMTRLQNPSVKCIVLSGLEDSSDSGNDFDVFLMKNENLMNSIIPVVEKVLKDDSAVS
ncbi:MAG: response regulator [Pyrinomonadaceae bacterium]|nr:response regulator [Pyrinomonadaceae bacterium]MCX7639462.1 response regulator [Pyrinomonadaceae bacterium]MDW8304487.1 response regulator [Acidobacteriota bacterium]